MSMVRGKALRYGVSLAALLSAAAMVTTAAEAGGFGIREQSTYYQGMSFAGEAVGNDLSSIFWNPAATAALTGINSSTNITLVAVDTDIHASPTSLYGIFRGDNSGSISDPGVVPASYFNYQINDRLFVGMAINSPFSFTTKPDNLNWAGSPFATTSKVVSYNFNPTFAYKVTPTLTIGAGVQIEYFDVNLQSGAAAPIVYGPFPVNGRSIEGNDWGIGATAGLIWKPAEGTQVGLGYRSAVDINLSGTCKGLGLSNVSVAGVGNPLGCYFAPASVSANLTLPDVVSLGLRQNLTHNLAFMGTVEWTRWSSLGNIKINDASGVQVDALPLNYKDGWFFSGGLEYAYDPFNTFRFGVAYEISPINDTNRTVLLPDANRWWLSVGSSHRLTEKVSIDLAYTHLIVEDGAICGGPGCALLDATSQSKANIVSAALKYKWGGGERELEPLK